MPSSCALSLFAKCDMQNDVATLSPERETRRLKLQCYEYSVCNLEDFNARSNVVYLQWGLGPTV